MSYFHVSHTGGPAGSVVVNDSGTSVVLPDERPRSQDGSRGTPGRGARRYALITADLNNVGNIFLKLHLTEDAEYGKGIYLPPGGFYEITDVNLYQGPIKAISAPGQVGTLYTQVGT